MPVSSSHQQSQDVLVTINHLSHLFLTSITINCILILHTIIIIIISNMFDIHIYIIHLMNMQNEQQGCDFLIIINSIFKESVQ